MNSDQMNQTKYKYICSKCNYGTNSKQNYDNHLNRKNKCNINGDLVPPADPDKIKVRKGTVCKSCNKEFATTSSFNLHCKTKHKDVNIDALRGTKTITINIEGDHNNSNVNASTNIDNSTTNVTVNMPITLVPYYSYDADDLTLYEQYHLIASPGSRFINILNHFQLNKTKEQYHNIRMPSLKHPSINVFNGNEWTEEIANQILDYLLGKQIIVFWTIIKRFRLFLSKEACRTLPVTETLTLKTVMPGDLRRRIAMTKSHLYNNRNRKIDFEDEVPEPSDPIWWAIDKAFTWTHVRYYIYTLEDNNIDLGMDDVNQLNKKVKAYIDANPDKQKYFRRLKKHLPDIIALLK